MLSLAYTGHKHYDLYQQTICTGLNKVVINLLFILGIGLD